MIKNKTPINAKINTEIWKSNELYKHLLEEEKKLLRAIKPITSGMPTLDNYIKQFVRGDVTVLSGRSGHGKTLLATTLTANMCNDEINVLWFSYEVGSLDFLRKTMDANGNIPGFLMPYRLIPNNLKFIEEKIIECKKEYGLDVCFIDHLHYLCDISDVRLTLEIGRVMRWLKEKAIEHNIAIFLIAHVGKIPDFKIKNLDNDSLRDASSIAQECDNVFFIVRSDEHDTQATLKITKNRRYGYRNKYIGLDKKGNYLVELDKTSV